MREPDRTFSQPTCKGSIKLGTACGHCEKCAREKAQMALPPASALRPRMVEYDVGKDAHGRPVTLRMTRGSGGEETWEVLRQAGGQLDTSERVSGLTADNLRALAAAVQP